MKRFILLLLVLLTVSQAVDAQMPVKRKKRTKPKPHRVEQPPNPRPATMASYSTDITITVGNVSFKMIHITAGGFTMGATAEQQDAFYNEMPAHRVKLTHDYCLAETEVTQALWREVMGSNPSYFKGDDLPVEKVSWDDCQKFISRLNELTDRHFRLPTEAEWEFAARGGSRGRGCQYAGSNNLDDVAWYMDNIDRKTHPVKGRLPNELGLYDMSGNVMEWCQDWFDDYSSAPQTNPTGPANASYHVCRGGGWDCEARSCRVACRGNAAPDYRYSNLGLRLALSE